MEFGELTYKQAQDKYGIQGRSTVLVWLRKHSKLDITKLLALPKTQTPQQLIKELEAELEKEKLKVKILNTVIDIADETMNANIRKKHLPELSKKLKLKEGK